MKEKKIDLVWGFLIGIVSSIVVAGIYYYMAHRHAISYEMLKANKVFWSPMLQMGIIGNVVWIYFFNRFDKGNLLRGVGFATILMVIFVMYIKFSAS